MRSAGTISLVGSPFVSVVGTPLRGNVPHENITNVRAATATRITPP
jgi:hypothetical protein